MQDIPASCSAPKSCQAGHSCLHPPKASTTFSFSVSSSPPSLLPLLWARGAPSLFSTLCSGGDKTPEFPLEGGMGESRSGDGVRRQSLSQSCCRDSWAGPDQILCIQEELQLQYEDLHTKKNLGTDYPGAWDSSISSGLVQDTHTQIMFSVSEDLQLQYEDLPSQKSLGMDYSGAWDSSISSGLVQDIPTQAIPPCSVPQGHGTKLGCLTQWPELLSLCHHNPVPRLSSTLEQEVQMWLQLWLHGLWLSGCVPRSPGGGEGFA